LLGLLAEGNTAMKIDQFRSTLQEFARQARNNNIATGNVDNASMANLAEQLDKALGSAKNLRTLKSESTTISFAPSSQCPCCGK
jgi:hypothetical protein